jgi:hypothetical protein
MPNRVLIAGHSQVKYFDQYLKLSDVDVVSFSGYRIEQMWGVIGHKVTNYALSFSILGQITCGMTPPLRYSTTTSNSYRSSYR